MVDIQPRDKLYKLHFINHAFRRYLFSPFTCLIPTGKDKFVNFTRTAKRVLLLRFYFRFLPFAHLHNTAPQTFNIANITKVKIQVFFLFGLVKKFFIKEVAQVLDPHEGAKDGFVLPMPHL